jgi:hypothetical protein
VSPKLIGREWNILFFDNVSEGDFPAIVVVEEQSVVAVERYRFRQYWLT